MNRFFSLYLSVDASVFAVPGQTQSRNDVFDYIDTLIVLSTARGEKWITLLLSERLHEKLVTCSIYPLRDNLANLFNKYRIKEYDFRTVNKIVNGLLAIRPTFEKVNQVCDILIENFVSQPDILSDIAHDSLKEETERFITLLAIICKYSNEPACRYRYIFRNTTDEKICFRTMIHDFEHKRDNLLAFQNLPQEFEGEILICSNPSRLLEYINQDDIFVNCIDDYCIELTIRINLLIYEGEYGLDEVWKKFPFTIGKEFREKAQKICMIEVPSLPEKILRSIRETIKKENMNDTHPLRCDSSGNSPQRTRGLDQAWRRDIDREYHLHYWLCVNGSIELASVNRHNDFSIPE